MMLFTRCLCATVIILILMSMAITAAEEALYIMMGFDWEPQAFRVEAPSPYHYRVYIAGHTVEVVLPIKGQ